MNGATVPYIQDEGAATAPVLPGTDLSLGAILSGAAGSTQIAEIASVPIHVISQFGAPRWVLPAELQLAIPVIRSWRPYSVKSRMKWSVIVGACRFRALNRLPGVTCLELRCDMSYWRQHIPDYSDSWVVIAYIGNPSSTRKALLFFNDRNAQVRAVVKVPLCTGAKAAIINEAQVLKAIQNRLAVPEMLFSDDHEGIAGQSWVEGKSVSRQFREEHVELLLQLASDGSRMRLTNCRERLRDRIASLATFSGSSVLIRAMALLDIENDIPECIEHGDFMPWNLRRMDDGRLTAIDWEWSKVAGFPWQDICRYFYLQAYLFRERADIWNRIITHPLLGEYRRRLNLSTEIVRALTAYFLLNFACDAHEEGDPGKVGFAVAKIQELLNG